MAARSAKPNAPQAHLYEGARTQRGVIVEVDGNPLDPRLDWMNHSPTGFEWGYGGSGPAQLALAILGHHFAPLGGEQAKALALECYQGFKAAVVVNLPHARWRLTTEDIQGWLKAETRQRQRVANPAAPAAPSGIAALRQDSAYTPDVHGGEAIAVPERAADLDAWHTQTTGARQALKRALANNKILAKLVVAGLHHGRGIDLQAYLDQAAHWIVTAAQALGQPLWAQAGLEVGGEPRALSPYYRYELHQQFADLLVQQPDLVFQHPPQIMADWLAKQSPARVDFTDGQPITELDWVSAGAVVDLQLAYARALTQVLAIAGRCDFNRDLDTLLTDARRQIESIATERADALGQRFDLDPTGHRIALLHYIAVGGRLYATTLERLFHDSVALIERYQAALAADNHAEAAALAERYQAQRLGYTGLAHHFGQAVQAIDRVALEAHTAPNDGADNQPDAPRPQ